MTLTIPNADTNLYEELKEFLKQKSKKYKLEITKPKIYTNDEIAIEIEKRVKEYESGKMKVYSADEFEEKLEEMYKQKYEKYHI